ncbi:unnamed protein product, partial [Laminaria digitata]
MGYHHADQETRRCMIALFVVAVGCLVVFCYVTSEYFAAIPLYAYYLGNHASSSLLCVLRKQQTHDIIDGNILHHKHNQSKHLSAQSTTASNNRHSFSTHHTTYLPATTQTTTLYHTSSYLYNTCLCIPKQQQQQ